MISDNVVKEAAKVTLGVVGAFLFNIICQVQGKTAAVAEHKKLKAAGSKEPFNRYTSDLMIAADRSVGNFLEWQVPFCLLFWLNAFVTGKELWIGWIWVGSRILYPILARLGGITKSGPGPLIFLATCPGYAVIFRYGYLIWKAI
jgi:hypothetical protein